MYLKIAIHIFILNVLGTPVDEKVIENIWEIQMLAKN